ncbi:F0F1 ATP synthase subunit I [bacterium]|nr:F0F1 ATP synthase subunit I [bacterium]
MNEDPDQARLRSLEERIDRARGKDAPKRADTGKGFSQGEVAWRMVLELVTGMLLGLAIGYGLDVLFGTRPFLLILFALLGFAAGVRTMMGTARQMAKDAETSATDKED